MLILQRPLEILSQREKDEMGIFPSHIELARLPGIPESFIIPITQDAMNALKETKLIYENLEIEPTRAGRPRINNVAGSDKISAILASDSYKKGSISTGVSIFIVKCEDEDRFPEMNDYQVIYRDTKDDIETEIVDHILDIKENTVFVLGSPRGDTVIDPLIIEIIKNEEASPRAQSWGPSDYLDILPIPERILKRIHMILDPKTGKTSISTTGFKKLETIEPKEE